MNTDSILVKVQDYWKILFPVTSRFPKNLKFSLADRIQQLASELMELVVEAYFTSPEHKKPMLVKANIKVELLRRYLRVAFELGVFTSSVLLRMQEPLDEIGRMIGGWMKKLP